MTEYNLICYREYETDIHIFTLQLVSLLTQYRWFSARLRSLIKPSAQPSFLNRWWSHQMRTFFALLAICAGNSLVTGEFPSQSPVTRSFDVFFDRRLNIQLSKQSWGWWFETPSRSLWRDCYGFLLSASFSCHTKKLWCVYASVVRALDCRLFGTKPLPKPMMIYCSWIQEFLESSLSLWLIVNWNVQNQPQWMHNEGWKK